MYTKSLFLGAFASICSAQTLQQVLENNNASLSTLTTLLAAAPELLVVLNNATNITVLAPSNDALTSLNTTGLQATDISALLTYHVLNGSYPSSVFTNTSQFLPTLLMDDGLSNGQVVNARLARIGDDDSYAPTIFSGLGLSSGVSTADLNFTGGTVHVIDNVLTLPQSISSTALDLNQTSFYGALNYSSLTNTIDELPNATVFIPSNSAFANIANLAANLTTEQVGEILAYHVVNGTVGYSTSLVNGSMLPTYGGGEVSVSISNGSIFVNSARVIRANILVGNGVVHIIDNVLNPNNTDVIIPSSTSDTTTTNSAAFPSASTATDGAIPYTTNVVATTTITQAPEATDADSGTEGSVATSSSSAGAEKAVQTGLSMGMGAAALFGVGAFWVL